MKKADQDQSPELQEEFASDDKNSAEIEEDS